MVVRFSSCTFWTLAILALAARAVHADPLESVAKQLAKGMAKYKKDGRVAVLVFPYENGDLSSGSSLVSERLTTLMAQRKHVNMIERSRLADLLGEMRLEESGVTDSTGAPKAGGILGVDAVVTGTLTDSMEGETEVNARLIRMETGEIIAAATANIDRTWQDQPRRPPPSPGTEEDDDSHYVMHESPLIFTPTSRRGPPLPPPEAVVAYNSSQGGGYAGVTQSPAAAAVSPSVTVINPVIIQQQPPERRRPRRVLSAAQAQMYYALAATLDGQGDHRQAAHYYRRVREQYPSSSGR